MKKWFKHPGRLLFPALMLALSAHVLVLTTGCDSGGDGPDGSSTIQGTVNSFSSNGAFYMPAGRDGFMQELAGRVLDLFVPQAHAAVAGVVVSVQGTELSGTTDETGFFIISGVPPGPQILLFTFNGQTEALPITVPDNGIVTLTEIEIENGSVDVASVQVVEFDDDNGNANSNDNDDNGNDNDDNGNDNGDNGNDNDDNDNDDDDDDDDNGNDNG